MTETRGTGPQWSGEPLVTAVPQPDWAALAERHEQEVRRRKQIRMVAAGVAATAAVGGIIATVVQVSGTGEKTAHAPATAVNRIGGGQSASTGPGASSTAPGEEVSPFAAVSASATAGGPSTGASRSAAPAAGASSAAPPPPARTPSATPSPKESQTPPPAAANPYSAAKVCGGGYRVVDSHSLGGASVYLLFNAATGSNCVVTLPDHPGGSVAMNATLAVQGKGSASDPGSFTYYAGPVTENAPKSCVQWGGSYQGASWTSGWSHCG
ncbi:hypothetical protein [Kitasatospora sp. HPMI-4]|uniref:hypothetical protein n=1 Tax=Kitasatospora sp. HPMI-4 TaxID=3448443 RepID=UPI003F1D8836